MSKWGISNYLCSMVCVLQSLCLSGTTCEPFFLPFSGCLSLPPSFWFILSPFNVPAPPTPFSLRDQNRQHQFCRPTTVALASANWTRSLWVSPMAIGRALGCRTVGAFVLLIFSTCESSSLMSHMSENVCAVDSVKINFLLNSEAGKNPVVWD